MEEGTTTWNDVCPLLPSSREVCIPSPTQPVLEPSGHAGSLQQGAIVQLHTACPELVVSGGEVTDGVWPCGLTVDFIEQCARTLDAMQDVNCLTIANDQLRLPGYVSLEGMDGSIALDSPESLPNYVTMEDMEGCLALDMQENMQNCDVLTAPQSLLGYVTMDGMEGYVALEAVRSPLACDFMVAPRSLPDYVSLEGLQGCVALDAQEDIQGYISPNTSESLPSYVPLEDMQGCAPVDTTEILHGCVSLEMPGSMQRSISLETVDDLQGCVSLENLGSMQSCISTETPEGVEGSIALQTQDNLQSCISLETPQDLQCLDTPGSVQGCIPAETPESLEGCVFLQTSDHHQGSLSLKTSENMHGCASPEALHGLDSYASLETTEGKARDEISLPYRLTLAEGISTNVWDVAWQQALVDLSEPPRLPVTNAELTKSFDSPYPELLSGGSPAADSLSPSQLNGVCSSCPTPLAEPPGRVSSRYIRPTEVGSCRQVQYDEPPATGARLAEVECELTVSDEAAPASPPAAPGASGPAPYHEHNYDYPLEPTVAGEVCHSVDHVYASRPASPGPAACSATDHRYAYSPPAALTEEDLIRSISDQLGLPHDHGYSQRQSAAPAPTLDPNRAPDVAAVPVPAPGPGRAATCSLGPALARVPAPLSVVQSDGGRVELMEPCMDWEPALDEPAGHWVDPNLVMGLDVAGRRSWSPTDAGSTEQPDRLGAATVADDAELAHLLFDVDAATLLPAQGRCVTPLLHAPDGSVTPLLHASDGNVTPLLDTPDGNVTPLLDAPDGNVTPLLDAPDGNVTPLLDAPDGSLAPLSPRPERFMTPLGPRQGESLVSRMDEGPPEVDVPLPTVSADWPEDRVELAAGLPSGIGHMLPEVGVSPPGRDDETSRTGIALPGARDVLPDVGGSPSMVDDALLSPETNIVICRSEDEPADSQQSPEPDAEAAVSSVLRQLIAARLPVTRDQLAARLARQISAGQLRALDGSGSFLVLWLRRCAALKVRPPADARARTSYTPEFKLLVLRFVEFMSPDAVSSAFSIRPSLLSRWRRQKPELIKLAENAHGVRAKGGGKKRKETDVDRELLTLLEARAKASDTSLAYEEARQIAKQLYARHGLKAPRSKLWLRGDLNIQSRRCDATVIRWLLTEFECGRSTARDVLDAHAVPPGGRFWAQRLLSRYPELATPHRTWKMVPPETMAQAARQWAEGLQLASRDTPCFLAEVPIMKHPAACAVAAAAPLDRQATLLISCSLEGAIMPAMLILQGDSLRVYADRSGLLTVRQPAGRLDAARLGLWLQLVGGHGPAGPLVMNGSSTPRLDAVRRRAAAGGRSVTLAPAGLAVLLNPLMAARHRLMVSLSTHVCLDGSNLLPMVRSHLDSWKRSGRLSQDLARVRHLYRRPAPGD